VICFWSSAVLFDARQDVLLTKFYATAKPHSEKNSDAAVDLDLDNLPDFNRLETCVFP